MPKRESRKRPTVPPHLQPVEIDNRGLEPPEPMMRVLEALNRLQPNQLLRVRNDREPMFLYPRLDERGIQHVAEEQEDGTYIIWIWPGEGA